MSRQQLIGKNKNLFWYTPESEKQKISDAILVERILNDGTLDDYSELVKALGGKRVAEVFFSAKGRQKANYYPEIYHFFSLVLRSMFSEILNDKQGEFDYIDYSEAVDYLVPDPPTEEVIKETLTEYSISGI